MHKSGYSRRQFLRDAGAAAAMFSLLPSDILGANEKINIAGIGIGGRGGADINAVAGENIVALCDVDSLHAAKMFEKYPDAKKFVDFHDMLADMGDKIDAVVVGTPDHTHAVASMAVMEHKKHLYCEKPLAHSIYEVRRLRKAAHENGIIAQLGNQGHSSGSIRTFCEWIWDGAIGNVTEVHAACDAFKDVYCQIDNLQYLGEKQEPPEHLNWDLWLGPAQYRSYHPFYAPWNWRGWMPFGTGAIGDWVCHVVDPSFWALDLGAPESVRAEVMDYDPLTQADVYPRGTEITFQFPANAKRGPIKLIWYDGEKRIPRPQGLSDQYGMPGTGALVIGDEGWITHGSHGAGGVKIVPDEAMNAYEKPEESIPRVPGHQQDWLNAIREGRQAGSNFDYGGPLTEIALLGAIAIKFPGAELAWDSDGMKFTNHDLANAFVHPAYRENWNL